MQAPTVHAAPLLRGLQPNLVQFMHHLDKHHLSDAPDTGAGEVNSHFNLGTKVAISTLR